MSQKKIEVNTDLNLKTTVPPQVEISVDQSLLIPFELDVFDFITIDTLIEVTENLNITDDDTIPLDQKVNIDFDKLLPVKSTVPVDLNIIDTLHVGLSLRIPVDLSYCTNSYKNQGYDFI